ncbi:helix-turn-helix transcriptional regulator [Streptomyces sp. NPDC127069]|uniref:helix-turn-helix domain-containing protein n=1 Tax=Streptomyces sp. NPDC127069 TaxID=3347128 RepID=UPI003649EC2F
MPAPRPRPAGSTDGVRRSGAKPERRPGAEPRERRVKKGTIVRLLSEGLEDKVIARRLGMSERTCQRHIAEIMRAVGAKSRFQAWYLLSALNPKPS